jgi:hypothetical protein
VHIPPAVGLHERLQSGVLAWRARGYCPLQRTGLTFGTPDVGTSFAGQWNPQTSCGVLWQIAAKSRLGERDG